VVAGGNATFTVTASGTTSSSYQQRVNGTNIAGGPSDALTLTNVRLTDAGSYAVQVSNIAGSTNSAVAVLTVTLPPARVQVVDTPAAAGRALTVPVVLSANGNENALGFSLSFDPTVLTYVGTVLDNGAMGAALNINSNQIGAGKLGLVLALPTGTSFNFGHQEVVKVSLRAASLSTSSSSVAFSHQLVSCEVSDAAAGALPAASDFERCEGRSRNHIVVAAVGDQLRSSGCG
jgi:hypothetical protein